MHARTVVLHTADPDALRPFYAETLALPVVDTAAGFLVRVGSAAVEFRPGTGDPTYHLAFSVPGETADAAADWLADRTDLLRDGDRAQFRYDFLDATAVYFADPAGNVLELLARDGREGPANPFGPASLLDVAEVGLVVDDVPSVADALAGAFDLSASDGSDETFSYLGGRDGSAFVVVSPGRDWYPTSQPAEPHPVTVVAEGGTATVSAADGAISVVGIDE